MMYRRILVPIDESEAALGALPHAAFIALAADADVLLAYVAGASEFRPSLYGPRHDDESQIPEPLRRALAPASELGIRPRTSLVVVHRGRGSIADAQVRLVMEHGCDLIILTSHPHRRLRQLILPSPADAFL